MNDLADVVHGVLQRGAVRVPESARKVTDADEEVSGPSVISAPHTSLTVSC